MHGDDAGRILHEVIRDVVAAIGLATGAASFRADFFVRWGHAGGYDPSSTHILPTRHSHDGSTPRHTDPLTLPIGVLQGGYLASQRN